MNSQTPSPDELEAELEQWVQSDSGCALRDALAAGPPLPGEVGIAERLLRARTAGAAPDAAALWRQMRRWRLAALVASALAACALLLLLSPPRAAGPAPVPAPPPQVAQSAGVPAPAPGVPVPAVAAPAKPGVMPSHGVSGLRRRLASTRSALESLRKRSPFSSLQTRTPKTKASS